MYIYRHPYIHAYIHTSHHIRQPYIPYQTQSHRSNRQEFDSGVELKKALDLCLGCFGGITRILD